MNLDQLSTQIEICRNCGLGANAYRAVPGEGPLNPTLMLIGEAPGANEDRNGRPFQGNAGAYLDELLALGGITRWECYITNVLKHRPPDNRDPWPDEIAACLPWLEYQVKLVQPKLVVTLGRFSTNIFMPGSVLARVHREVVRVGEYWVLPMYHPAAALHNGALRRTLEADFKALPTILGQIERAELEPAYVDHGITLT